MFDKLNTKTCPCGKEHIFESKIVTEKGAINKLPQLLLEMDLKSAFIIGDKNTFKAAGEKVIDILENAGIKTKKFVFMDENLEPDERNVGLAIMNFDPTFDTVIGVGSGVINDISKIVSNVSGKKYIIVATAPSMDGYASKTSSMYMQGLKISLNSKCADMILGDLDILSEAPVNMMVSGLGDMIAKYVAIAEWRISNIVTGEYYCEYIAGMIRDALKKCVDNADGLLKRDENSVRAVFEGLVLGGVAMNYAGISRPASGVEHYLSHIWDMRGLEFGTNVELHGIQCAVGTMYAAKIYEKIKNYTIDKEKALGFAKNFNFNKHSGDLRNFLGKGAEAMISLEEKEGKYDLTKHSERLDIIIKNWDKIIKIVKEEIPIVSELESIYKKIDMPICLKEIGIDESILKDTFVASKDIRDKYVLSRLCWDLGITDEILEGLR